MTDRNILLFNFSQANNNTQKYSNTIPSQSCQNGYPIARYLGNIENSWEVLYNIWVSYQNTTGAIFTYDQCVAGAPTSHPTQGPANIFIIRHCEKDISNPRYHINNNGIYRACQIVDYVNKLATSGTPISYIITCNSCPYNQSDPSMRPIQTASPTSFLLNIPMFVYGGSQDYSSVCSNLFTSGIFDGLNVLMVWEHTSVQQLVLNILNTAGPLNRLPPTVTPTNPDLYGDEYFLQFSTSNNICPDGNYKCELGHNNYNSQFDTSLPGLPACIGNNSQYYPYWNNYCYDKIISLKSSPSQGYIFNVTISKQPILTCYANCDLQIGLYQPLPPPCETSYKYYTTSNEIENDCQVPIDWQV